MATCQYRYIAPRSPRPLPPPFHARSLRLLLVVVRVCCDVVAAAIGTAALRKVIPVPARSIVSVLHSIALLYSSDDRRNATASRQNVHTSTNHLKHPWSVPLYVLRG